MEEVKLTIRRPSYSKSSINTDGTMDELIPMAVSGIKLLYDSAGEQDKNEFMFMLADSLRTSQVPCGLIEKIADSVMKDETDDKKKERLRYIDMGCKKRDSPEGKGIFLKYISLRRVLLDIAKKKYIDTPTPEEWSVFSSLKALHTFQFDLNTSMFGFIAISHIMGSGDTQKYHIHDLDFGIYKLTKKGERVAISWICKCVITSAKVHQNLHNKSDIKYSIGFDGVNWSMPFALKSMTLDEIAQVLKTRLPGVVNPDLLEPALSSVLHELIHDGFVKVFTE